ncbi:hypothetical protein ACMFMF_009121 [Clarireedia jacksonii]
MQARNEFSCIGWLVALIVLMSEYFVVELLVGERMMDDEVNDDSREEGRFVWELESECTDEDWIGLDWIEDMVQVKLLLTPNPPRAAEGWMDGRLAYGSTNKSTGGFQAQLYVCMYHSKWLCTNSLPPRQWPSESQRSVIH